MQESRRAGEQESRRADLHMQCGMNSADGAWGSPPPPDIEIFCINKESVEHVCLDEHVATGYYEQNKKCFTLPLVYN